LTGGFLGLVCLTPAMWFTIKGEGTGGGGGSSNAGGGGGAYGGNGGRGGYDNGSKT